MSLAQHRSLLASRRGHVDRKRGAQLGSFSQLGCCRSSPLFRRVNAFCSSVNEYNMTPR